MMPMAAINDLLGEDQLQRLWNMPLGSMLNVPASQLSLGASTDFGRFDFDMSETEDELVVTADLPGMKPEDMTVRVEKGVLTIEGKREEEAESKDKRTQERFFGSFQRSYSLPETVDWQDTASMKAKYKDGVLSVTVAKSPELKDKEQAKTVAIEAE